MYARSHSAPQTTVPIRAQARANLSTEKRDIERSTAAPSDCPVEAHIDIASRPRDEDSDEAQSSRRETESEHRLAWHTHAGPGELVGVSAPGEGVCVRPVRVMSASAVAARAAALPAAAVNNMEEEEEQERDVGGGGGGGGGREDQETVQLDIAVMNDDEPEDDDKARAPVEEMMMQEERGEAGDVALSEAESEQQLVGAQLRAMAVSAATGSPNGSAAPRTNAAARAAYNDTATSTATSTGTRSAGESVDDVNGQDRLKPFIRTCAKFESGSGSGDQDGMVSMEDGVDVAAKKRKTRRGKPKHRKLKPYSKQQLSYQQRLRCRATGRPTKTGRQPPAPYNTTQFLMEDHNDLPDLDEKLAAGGSSVAAMAAEVHSHFSKPSAPPRTRDSSFSIDSDEDYFYSSPEDEEEFLTKEFSSAYEDLHAERLGALTKTELIQEYIQLEAKVDLLTKRLRSKSAANQADPVDRDDPKDNETAKKLKIFQQRIDELLQQNEQLRRENELLRKQRHGSPMSSVDSESDSDSSTNCSCDDEAKPSPGSSPVPASYHASREKTTSRRKNSSVSSVDSESDSTTGESSCPDASPKATTGASATNNADVANGHATIREIDGLPT